MAEGVVEPMIIFLSSILISCKVWFLCMSHDVGACCRSQKFGVMEPQSLVIRNVSDPVEERPSLSVIPYRI